MSDNVCTRYVHVFMLFSLISMNKKLNQNRFRVYPKAVGIDMLFDWPCLK